MKLKRLSLLIAACCITAPAWTHEGIAATPRPPKPQQAAAIPLAPGAPSARKAKADEQPSPLTPADTSNPHTLTTQNIALASLTSGDPSSIATQTTTSPSPASASAPGASSVDNKATLVDSKETLVDIKTTDTRNADGQNMQLASTSADSIQPPMELVDFDTRALNTNNAANVDLSAFSQDGYTPPGNYLLDIYLNGEKIAGQTLINFVDDPRRENWTIACLTPPLIHLLALKPDILKQRQQASVKPGQCLNLTSQYSHVRYDPGQQRLDITVPQAWLEYQEAGWTPPARWDNGINGVIADYNILFDRYMPYAGESNDNLSLYGTLGANLGSWRLRSDYQYYRSNSGNQHYAQLNFPQTYLFRPLPSIKSRISFGQTYFSSDIFEGFRYIGIRLESDQRMLPPSLQGYAPQITGIARTPAQVILSQQGRIIYQTRVPAGPFVLPALSQSVQGNLDVTVRESDGEVRHWQVNTASVPLMTRQGQLQYKLSAGQGNYTDNNRTQGPLLLAGEARFGLWNKTTLYGGVLAAGADYHALAAGIGEDLGLLGALSFDVTRSDARIHQQPRVNGYSYRVNYAKTFDSTGSSVSFIGYRFSQRSFMTMSRFMDLWQNHRPLVQEKQSFSLIFSQYLSLFDSNFSLSVSRLSYWNNNANNNYQFSVSKMINTSWLHGASVSLTLARNDNGYQQPENQIYLSFSLPFNSNEHAGNYLSYSVSSNNHGDVTQNLGYTGYYGNDTNWSLGASHYRRRNQQDQNSLSANFQQQSQYGQLSVDGNISAGDYRSIGLNWYGAATATRHGLVFHRTISGNEPRMMIAAGTPGVPVNHGESVTNGLGLAVVNGGNSYLPNDTSIDVSKLPDDVEIQNSVVSDTLTEGAIGFRRITAIKGAQLYGTIHLADGKTPPFGAQVISRHSGKVAGMVGDSGVVLLTGITPEDRQSLEVKVAGQTLCRLALPDHASLDSGMLLLPCQR